MTYTELQDRIIACLECEKIAVKETIDCQHSASYLTAQRIANDIQRLRLDYERELEKFKTLSEAIDSELKK